jgi:hypothetical protein
MTTPTTQMNALPLQALLALQTHSTTPGNVLPAELLDAGEVEVLSERTVLLHRVLEALSEDDLHLPALVAIWNAARDNDPIGQRLLCSLLEVRQSGLELLQEMIRPSQSMRCCLLQRRGRALGPRAEAVSRAAWNWMGQVGIECQDVEAAPGGVLSRLHQRAQEHIKALVAGGIQSNELSWLRGLAETELEARAQRLENMAERVGAYDGRAIARILPHLSREEERIRDTRHMLVQWPETDELCRRSPVLVNFLEERSYRKLVDALETTAGGRELAHVLRLLPQRVPVTRSLLFVAATLRAVQAAMPANASHPLDAARSLMVALQIMQPDGSVLLAIDEEQARCLKPLIERLSFESPRPGTLCLRYHDDLHYQLLSPDGTPVLVEAARQVPRDIRQLVLDNLQNEHMLCGFLGSPRVVSSPGLVEIVVRRTRSIKILLDIANRRELHTGHANGNVPEALLTHPSNIPVSALRKFVHVRYVDRSALTNMANRGTRVRPEVRNMALAYLKSLGNR